MIFRVFMENEVKTDISIQYLLRGYNGRRKKIYDPCCG